MTNDPKASLLKIKLCTRIGEPSTFIDAQIIKNGDFELSVQDIVTTIHGNSGVRDCESHLTVAKDDKDRLLLALLEQLYCNDLGVQSKLMVLLKAKSIPYIFDN